MAQYGIPYKTTGQPWQNVPSTKTVYHQRGQYTYEENPDWWLLATGSGRTIAPGSAGESKFRPVQTRLVSPEQQRRNLERLRLWRKQVWEYGWTGRQIAPPQFEHTPTYKRPTPTATPTPSPQPTPTAPISQPTPTSQIGFTPATPQQPTYQPTPTQTYQSSYYQTNAYKPYSYQQDTFGDKPFSYAYQRPRLQQSYTGI